jgi:hypothetical protein
MFLQAIAWVIVAAIAYGLYLLFGIAAGEWGTETAATVYVGLAVLIYIMFRTF